MENETNELITQQDDTEETVNIDKEEDTQQEETSDESNEQIEELEKKIKTLEVQKKQWREKALKAQPQQETKKQKEGDLSSKDLYALMQAKVHEDDIDDVLKVAKLEGVSVAEALKLDLTQTILAKKSEYRRTAEVTNTGAAKKGTQKVSTDTLIKNLSKGEVPEKGSTEAEELFWARRGGKR